MTALAAPLTAPQLPHKHQECQKTKREETSADHRSAWKRGAADSLFPPGIGSGRPESAGRGGDAHTGEKHTKARFRGERAAAASTQR